MATARWFTLVPREAKAKSSTKEIGSMISKMAMASTLSQVVQFTLESGKLGNCTVREK